MKNPPPPLILHVIHHLLTGGMENGLVNLINSLPASKYRHAIVCIEDYSDFRLRIENPNVEVIALHRSKIGVWKLRRELYGLCRNLRPAIVHSRNQSGLDALLPARLAGVRHCIHGEHGWDVDNIDGKNWKQTWLKRLHSPLIGRYITVSKHLERYLVKHIGIKPSRISQVYNGVDTEKFRPNPLKSKNSLPPEFRSDDLVIIGTVGRIQPIKAQATLLYALFDLVTKKRPDLRHRLRLVIVGSGPLLPDLKLLAETLNISELIWFAGSIEGVSEIIQSFDIFVLPSLNEGISNTLLEAMATGIPVIATAVGGNTELVQDKVCGRLFSPNDTDTLSQLLIDYCLDIKLRQVHGSAARQIALDRYSLSAMVAQYEAIYDQMCKGNRVCS